MVKHKRVYLNNKSRRGWYIYIKETNKPARYYRYKPQKSIKTYIDTYSKITQKQEPKIYLTKIQKRGQLNSNIKKGINSTILKDIHALSYSQIHKQTKELLKPLILDPELLDIITQEENLKKINHRFESRISIYTDDNEECANIVKIKMTPQESKIQTTNNISKGEYINSQWVQKMKLAGYWVNEAKIGRYVHHVDILIIFRRG